MQVLRAVSELSRIRAPIVLAIGVFDGIHLGHQSVLRRAMAEAAQIGGIAIPLTFDPHPARILNPGHAPLLLTAPEHKIHLLSKMGFRQVLVLPFDSSVAATEASDFVTSLARSNHRLAAICVGARWSFGKGRKGNVELLKTLGRLHGFNAIGIEETTLNEEVVSSTRVRQAVALGDFDRAETLLGRPYTVLGSVVEGKKLGRTLGFPTANLRIFNEQLPPSGVYAVRARRLSTNSELTGVANLGVRPTLAEITTSPTLEVHIIDFHEECYGESFEVRFVSILRQEARFPDLESLRNQIEQDKSHAIQVLAAKADSRD